MPTARTPSKTCSHVVLPLNGVRQAALEQASAPASSTWSSIEKSWHGELRMRDDDVGDALLERPVDDRERVVAGEVARREDQAVAGDRAEHVARLGQELGPRRR